MEGSRGPFFPSGRYHHLHPPTSDVQALNLSAAASNPAVYGGAPANPNQDQPQQQPQQPPPALQRVMITREQDQYMPIANVIRIMRRMLPSHAKISDEAKETVQECVSEFISFITSEANQKCQQEQRKTVTADDLLWAMEKLGFDDYVGPLSLFLHRYRDGNRGSVPSPGAGYYSPRAPPPPEMPVPPQQQPPPPYFYEYPVGMNYQMGSGVGSSSGGSGSSGGGGGGAPAYYDPYGYLRNDRF